MCKSSLRYGGLGLLALAVLPLAMWAAGSARAQSGPPPLFATAAVPPGTPPEVSPLVLRRRAVTVNSAALGGQGATSATTLTINLFDDTTVTATRTGVDVAPAGNGYVWLGRLLGPTPGTVTLVVTGGTLAGDITAGMAKYQVRPLSGALHWVRQIHSGGFPNEREVAAPADSSPLAPPPMERKAATDNGRIIDVAVLYTNDVVTAVGAPGALAEINASIADTNAAYGNSGINQRVRLVYHGAISYTESGSQDSMLDQLQHASDGVMDSAHTIRDQYGADIVALLVEEGSFCGIAFGILNPVSITFAPKAFTVVNRGCASGNHSFAHELGHLMGARHDRFVDPTNNSPYTYNHGYVEPGNTWRTVMAYVNACGSCPRLQYFSNPNVLYSGIPMGIAEGQPNAADNAKTLNNTGSIVAQFRDCKVSCASPEVLWSAAVAPNPAPAGAPVTYSFTAATTGLFTRDLTARVQLPNGVRATAATFSFSLGGSGACQIAGGGSQVACNIGTLSTASSVTVNVVTRVTAPLGSNLCATGILAGAGDAGGFYKQAQACTRLVPAGLSPLQQP